MIRPVVLPEDTAPPWRGHERNKEALRAAGDERTWDVDTGEDTFRKGACRATRSRVVPEDNDQDTELLRSRVAAVDTGELVRPEEDRDSILEEVVGVVHYHCSLQVRWDHCLLVHWVLGVLGHLAQFHWALGYFQACCL